MTTKQRMTSLGKLPIEVYPKAPGPWTLRVRSQTLAPKAETLPQKAQDPDWSLRVTAYNSLPEISGHQNSPKALYSMVFGPESLNI